MDEFIGCKIATIDGEKTIDRYQETAEFALRALTELAKEDAIPLSSQEIFAVIVAFCLTHLNRKTAFDLLRIFSDVLRVSFGYGGSSSFFGELRVEI